jgi:hypothetical protein
MQYSARKDRIRLETDDVCPASKISIEPHKKKGNRVSSTMAKVNTAPIKWAQRSDSLYITIALAGE